MSEDRPVTLDFIAAQLQRIPSEIRILRDDVDVLAADRAPSGQQPSTDAGRAARDAWRIGWVEKHETHHLSPKCAARLSPEST
jgi:hypothetical protein